MSNKQAQRVFNKMYTNESTNRERIRFHQPGYQILLSSLLLIGTELRTCKRALTNFKFPTGGFFIA